MNAPGGGTAGRTANFTQEEQSSRVQLWSHGPSSSMTGSWLGGRHFAWRLSGNCWSFDLAQVPRSLRRLPADGPPVRTERRVPPRGWCREACCCHVQVEGVPSGMLASVSDVILTAPGFESESPFRPEIRDSKLTCFICSVFELPFPSFLSVTLTCQQGPGLSHHATLECLPTSLSRHLQQVSFQCSHHIAQ